MRLWGRSGEEHPTQGTQVQSRPRRAKHSWCVGGNVVGMGQAREEQGPGVRGNGGGSEVMAVGMWLV